MAEQSYTGGCHCGAVRFEANADLEKTNECNCSICTKDGFLWTFTPAEKFKLTSGEDATTEYLFNKHAIHHRFCKTCGTEAFASGNAPDGSGVVAINVRTLDDIDLKALDPTPIDGRSL